MVQMVDRRMMEQFILPKVRETRQWLIQKDVAWLVDWMTADFPGQSMYIHYLIKIHLSSQKSFANDDGNHLAYLKCQDGEISLVESLEEVTDEANSTDLTDQGEERQRGLSTKEIPELPGIS